VKKARAILPVLGKIVDSFFMETRISLAGGGVNTKKEARQEGPPGRVLCGGITGNYCQPPW
jgi:hypothetical protein